MPKSTELDLSKHSKHGCCFPDLPSSNILHPADYTESDLKWKIEEEEITQGVLTKLLQPCCHLQ